MKMQFSRRRNALVSKQTLVVGTSVSLVCLFLLGVSSFFPTLIPLAAKPGWALGATASSATRAIGSLFEDKNNVAVDRDRLQLENQVLQNENRMLRANLEDVTHLTGGAMLPASTIVAGVLARPPLSPYDTLVVSLGTVLRAQQGALVYGPGGVPIGTVEQSEKGIARVLLYSSPGRKVDGWIGAKRFPVTLSGESAGAFTASIAHASSVVVGDVLYLPGPGALPAGTVASVESDPSSTEDILFIVPYINIFSIPWVLITAGHE